MSTNLIYYPLRSRHIHSLPPEMITDSFWYLSFTEVRYAAQVCQRWRDLGIDHPIFWWYIEATSITPGALELLRARIGQSKGRPFTFKVDVKGNSRVVERDLIDIIGAALHNVGDLSVSLDALVLMDLFAMLKYKAPKLKRLHLKLYSQDRCVPRIPLWYNVLGDIPGGLEFVHLDDILLDQGAEVMPCFTNVTYLEHCLPPSIEANFPAFVFRLCPSLKKFIFRCGRVTYGDPFTEADVEAISRLEFFCIDIAEAVSRAEFISRVPLNRVRDVTIARVLDPDSVYDFLAPLRSPFLFGFSLNRPPLSDSKQTFDIDVQDYRSRQRRTFAQFRSDYEHKPHAGEESCINALLENEEFHAQILTLSWDKSIGEPGLRGCSWGCPS
ncbi:hypothetical protein EXIGLDRAFT_824448 [Exidia glandulosa HHB12029]|uniref:F-box domain-containing protein n=1 Tax=Exidia glandulosa HHB12029 TaxID=1314781 RepID=A0A165J1T5_EXIGL|nr:hypothetical protein EXIGLDRAFT_824448 [Exidia glandulosa HHB12029]